MIFMRVCDAITSEEDHRHYGLLESYENTEVQRKILSLVG